MLRFLFLKIVFMSVGMSAAGVLVLLAERLFKNVISKRAVLVLWILPLILAVVPIGGAGILSGKSAPPSRSEMWTDTSETATVPLAASPELTVDGDYQTNTAVTESEPAAANTAVYTPTEREMRLPDIFNVSTLAALYFAILIIIAIKNAALSVKFRIMLKEFAEPLECESLKECKDRVGVKGSVEMLSVPFECSPFVLGIFRPKIVVPRLGIGDEALMHELTHIKNRDILYLLVVRIAAAVHFFNPLVYIFQKHIKKAMELSCDESVSSLMSEAERLEYSKSILGCAAPITHSSVCLSENGKNIKERIELIMTGNRKKRGASAVIISAVLMLAVAAGGTVTAAALNKTANVKSYIINNAVIVYSTTYNDGSAIHTSGKKYYEQNRASLVNTEVYKGFSADLRAEYETLGQSGVEGEEYIVNISESEPEIAKWDADVHIEMEKFIRSFDGGKVWQGLFKVNINGENVLENALGCISEVPGDGAARGVARLHIEDGDKYFDIDRIMFDLESDSIINASYEKDKNESFDVTETRYFRGTENVSVTENSETNSGVIEDAAAVLEMNPQEGRLNISDIYLSANDSSKYINEIVGEKYTFGENSVSGKFYIESWGGIIFDEIEGTISGTMSGNIGFKSADGNISVDIIGSEDEGMSAWYPDTRPLNPYADNDFERTAVQSSALLRLADLPFTLSLNEDGTKVLFKLKDGFNPDSWYYSYSSYIDSDSDVYNCYVSELGARETTLDLSREFGSHNLQFTYLNSEPYAKRTYIDVMFKVFGGKIIYESCNSYIYENQNYSGEAAKPLIKEYWDDSEDYAGIARKYFAEQ